MTLLQNLIMHTSSCILLYVAEIVGLFYRTVLIYLRMYPLVLFLFSFFLFNLNN